MKFEKRAVLRFFYSFAISFNFQIHSMCFSGILLTVDPNLGHVDYGSFSDQTLMEMLIDGFSEQSKKRYQDSEGLYLDVCAWQCVSCDDAKQVIQIMEYDTVIGSLQLSYVPPSVSTLNVSDNSVSGSIDLRNLPANMQLLSLHDNQLSGTICLTQLPAQMRYLQIYNNELSGSFIAMNIPPHMVLLNASQNDFSPTAMVDAGGYFQLNLRESGVKSVVDKNGNALSLLSKVYI